MKEDIFKFNTNNKTNLIIFLVKTRIPHCAVRYPGSTYVLPGYGQPWHVNIPHVITDSYLAVCNVV